MAESKDDSGIDLGVFGRRPAMPQVTATEVVAGVLAVLWLLASGLFLLIGDPGAGTAQPLGWVLTLMAIFLPIALIWIAAASARTARMWREDSARLQASLDALRHAYVAQAQGGAAKPSIEKKLDTLVAAQKNAEVALATFVSRREEPPQRPLAPPSAPADMQPSLALGAPAEALAEPLTTEEFIRALNFPEDVNDREGFRALRRALGDRDTARLVRASQDVLTLLSQDGIYMDDLRPDRARPEVWRRFADGERGRAIAALGGVRDRSSLALTSARMRQDVIFRDAAHHFLRHFDKRFSTFAPTATDQELTDLSETRTARAFMLLGRVTGIFD